MTTRTIGHYRIVQKLASGGMGDVFIAEDTQLGREVALKMLLPDLGGDADQRSRLTREAKALAALNHPNIVTVHSVEQADGVGFITMELVKGRTLAELIPTSGVDLATFFRIAIPLVDALAAAHQHGIVHRDVKPSNVMVASDGRVKVLDFGIARPTTAVTASSNQVTASIADLQLAGTPAYMSPEQADGRTVDSRSDIFSLGVLFYEMLSGQRPFRGDTPATTLAAVLTATPRLLTEANANIPRALARAVQRALAKDPIERYQSAIDLRHDLQQAKDDLGAGADAPAPVSAAGWRKPLTIGILVGAVLIAAVAVTLLLMGDRDESRTAANDLRNAKQVTSALGVERYPTWSPDGLRVVYQASDTWSASNHDIWVTQAGGGDPINLTNLPAADDKRPSWSPDGAEIAFFSNRDGESAVFIVSALGGNPRKVLALPDVNPVNVATSAPQWTPDGNLVIPAPWLMAGSMSGRSGLLRAVPTPAPRSHEHSICFASSQAPTMTRIPTRLRKRPGGRPRAARPPLSTG